MIMQNASMQTVQFSHLESESMDASTNKPRSHISQQFNTDLEELKKHMLEMGGMVEKQFSGAMQALIGADSTLGERIAAADDLLDQMEMKIDEECNLIIARRQPAARDLRLVLAIVKAIRDLERIGDESSKIAKAAIKMSEQGEFPEGIVDLRSLGDKVQRMVNSALDSFARYDAEAAIAVVQEDKSVDNDYAIAMRSMVTFMMEDPSTISKVLNVLWALRAMERVGDHAKNICEHVIYMVAGTDVRHLNPNKMSAKINA